MAKLLQKRKHFDKNRRIHRTLLQLWFHPELLWNVNQLSVDISHTKWIKNNAILIRLIYIYISYMIYIYISNVSRLHYFLFILCGKCQQIIDWHFKEALDEITAEGGCDVFDGFCQNVFFFAEALPIWEIKFKITNIYKNIIMSLQKKVVRRMN